MNEEEMLADLGDQAFDKGKENIANAQYFTGKSYINNLASTPVRVTNVVFEPGSINDWHIHHGMSQILLVTGGTGWYQEWGKKPQKLKKGDVVTAVDGVKHWHGASKDSYFAHIAISEANPDGWTEWLEKVVDYDEFN